MKKSTVSASISILLLSSISITGALAQEVERRSDFNGDGFSDLAIGIPGKIVNGITGAGAIRVLYGSASGLTTTGSTLLQRGTTAPGRPGLSEGFGRVLEVGDFNGDGLDDLATSSVNAGLPEGLLGTMVVFYGQRAGLGLSRVEEFPNDSPGAEYGRALAAGDFQGDGFDDLAVGVPGTAFGAEGAGAVAIFEGSAIGLTFASVVTRQSAGMQVKRRGRFGAALSAGRLNHDSFDDLAVGAPEQYSTVVSGDQGGDVIAVFGSENGLSIEVEAGRLFNQSSDGIPGTREPRDGFGSVIMVGDIDSTYHDDIFVGVPNEDFENTPNGNLNSAGVGHLIVSTPIVASRDNLFFHQDVRGILGQLEAGDNFAAALGRGDFNGDGFQELVIGVPTEKFGNVENAGVFHVFYGPVRAPHDTDQQLWHHDAFGLGLGLQPNERFGQTFSAADYNGDGFDDLAVGASTAVAGVSNAGSVTVLYGSSDGLSAAGMQFWAEHSPGLGTSPAENAAFGASLATGRGQQKLEDTPRDGAIFHRFPIERSRFTVTD